jgi:hypothetical protein
MCWQALTMAAQAAVGAGASIYGGNAARQTAETNARLAQREADTSAMLAERNATVLDRSAEEAAEANALDVRNLRVAQNFDRGESRARAAASGLTTESFLDGLVFQAEEQEREVRTLMRQGELEVRNIIEAAELERFNARAARTSGQSQAAILRAGGRQAQMAGYIGAATSLLSAGSSAMQGRGGGVDGSVFSARRRRAR